MGFLAYGPAVGGLEHLSIVCRTIARRTECENLESLRYVRNLELLAFDTTVVQPFLRGSANVAGDGYIREVLMDLDLSYVRFAESSRFPGKGAQDVTRA